MLEIMAGLENDHWKRLIVRVSRTFQIGMDFFEEGEGEREVGRQAHHSN